MNRPFSLEGSALQIIGLALIVVVLALQFEPLMRGNEIDWNRLGISILTGLLIAAFGRLLILLTRIERNTRRD